MVWHPNILHLRPHFSVTFTSKTSVFPSICISDLSPCSGAYRSPEFTCNVMELKVSKIDRIMSKRSKHPISHFDTISFPNIIFQKPENNTYLGMTFLKNHTFIKSTIYSPVPLRLEKGHLIN